MSLRVGEIHTHISIGESPFSEQYLSVLHKIKAKRKVILKKELTFDGLVLNYTRMNEKSPRNGTKYQEKLDWNRKTQ